MIGQCCRGGRRPRRLSPWLSSAAGSLLPGVALVLLPKCPLCLAAWLTVVTGMSISAASGAWVWRSTVVVCVIALTLSTAQTLRRAGVRGTIRGRRDRSATYRVPLESLR